MKFFDKAGNEIAHQPTFFIVDEMAKFTAAQLKALMDTRDYKLYGGQRVFSNSSQDQKADIGVKPKE